MKHFADAIDTKIHHHFLNQTKQEQNALVWRLRYELRQAVFSENKKEARLFYEMLKEMNNAQLTDTLLYYLGKFNLPLSPLLKLYHRIRYNTF